MRITDTRIHGVTDRDSNIKAVVSVTIDDLITINYIRVMEYDGKDYVVMPGVWNSLGEHIDILKLNDKATREYFRKVILSAYKNYRILDDIYDLPKGYPKE